MKPTKRQQRIVEHFVKQVLNEGSTQQTYSKILEFVSRGY
jgi:hypothetical protein